jgi:hypothetical protein
MRALVIALFVVIAACDKTVPTPNGTHLIDRPTFQSPVVW